MIQEDDNNKTIFISFDKSMFSDVENAAFEIYVTSHQTLHPDCLMSLTPMAENRESFVTNLRNRKMWNKLLNTLKGKSFTLSVILYVRIFY